MGIWITPDTCKLRSSFSAPILGARAFITSSSRINQPTDAQRTVPGASNDARKVHVGMGWALSSHSTMTRGQALERVTLSAALASGDLEPFIRQAERDVIGPVDRDTFEADLERLIKAPRSERQTSRSSAPGGSPGR